jgi:transcription termination/antitermination protein NusG
MDEPDAVERPPATDPETEEAAEIQEAADSGDEAAQVALEETESAGASTDEPSMESVEELQREMTDQPEEGVIEVAIGDTSVVEPEAETEAPAPHADAEAEVIEPAAESAESEEEPAPAEAEAEAPQEREAASAAPAAAAEEAQPAKTSVEVARTPFEGPGEWYVVHTYAGYENKVKANLHSRINSMQMEDKIFDVVIPMEDVMEIKGGKKQVVQRKVFPGYLLVKMVYDNDSWYVVRNTPGVTGFVASGTGTKPTPLSRREVEKILAVKEETQKKPEYRLEWEEGDVVRIIAGPFADFQGTINEINVEQSKLKVLVNIFDRETPVELAFDQVAKA